MLTNVLQDLWNEPAPESPGRSRVDGVLVVAVAGIYMVTVAAACVGEEWLYFLIGSAVELVLFAVIIRTAWRWPAAAGAHARR